MFKKFLMCAALGAGSLVSAASAQTDVGGPILGDTTWDLAGSPYTVTTTIIVGANATLTVDPGVEIRVGPSLALTIGSQAFGPGTLRVLGTAPEPVLFTSDGGSTAGAWNDIFFTEFAAPESILSHAIIEFAGGKGANTGSITISNSQPLIENTTIRDSAQSGIWADYTAGSLTNLTITSCNFERCVSSTDGGGIRIANGSFHMISGCAFLACQANGSSRAGGGVYILRASDTLIENSTFTNCTAIINGNGGGIAINQALRCILSGNIVSNCQAQLRGGGVYCVSSNEILVDGCTFDNNSTTSGSLGGGGVYWQSCSAGSLSGCVFTNNSSGRFGGGFYISSSTSSQILGNNFTANNTPLGSTTSHGGAVYHDRSSSPTYRGNTFELNRSGGGGGAIFFESTNTTGIIFDNNDVIANESILNSVGGVWVSRAAPNSVFSNSHFLRNKTLAGGTNIGALAIRGANTRISDCEFEFNSAQANTGALNLFESPNFIIERSTFRENSAAGLAGAIAISSNSPSGSLAGDPINGTFNIFHDNTASQGSAIFYDVPFNADGSGDLDASFVCWGVDTQTEIQESLRDFFDDSTIGIIISFPLAPCPTPCHADTNDDTFVNVTDLLELLGSWGECVGLCRSDFDGSATVNVTDLLTLLGSWGLCP